MLGLLHTLEGGEDEVQIGGGYVEIRKYYNANRRFAAARVVRSL